MSTRLPHIKQNLISSEDNISYRKLSNKSNVKDFLKDTGDTYTSYDNNPSSIRSDNPFHKLQQFIGNQALQRLVASGQVRAKFRVSKPGDMDEQEADRVAEQVMGMSEKQISKFQTKISDNAKLHRKCKSCEKEEEKNKIIGRKALVGNEYEIPEHLEETDNRTRGGASGLDSSTKSFMEMRFGYDFSDVKVHADERASKSAEEINSIAYTVGNDIVFGKGQYSPNTVKGRKLLAHELVHVVQQHVEANTQSDQQMSIQRQSIPTIPIPVFDEFDPGVIVPDIPGIPDFLKGKQVKLSDVRKALDVLTGKKGKKEEGDCSPFNEFERVPLGKFTGLCCHRGSVRDEKNCCAFSRIGVEENRPAPRCCIGTADKPEVSVMGKCVKLEVVPPVFPPIPIPTPTPIPIPTPTPIPIPTPTPIPTLMFPQFSLTGFPSDSDEISRLPMKESRKLDDVKIFMQTNPHVKLDIIGHADQPALSSTINLKISQSRADNVKARLIKMGIVGSRIIISQGIGASACSLPGHQPACRKVDLLMHN